VLAALVSGGWLFRDELMHVVRPEVDRLKESFGAGVGALEHDASSRAHEKVDSLNGWHADSVVLNAGEMASLIMEGLPPSVRPHVDSLSVRLGDGRVTVSARLETTLIPKEQLGPLAGALDPWERVSAEGPVTSTVVGKAEWRVQALTLRGFTLPAETSQRLIEYALPGATGGVVSLALPKGISRLRVRPAGVALFRKESR
jgi:hypothetical protein